MDKFDEEASELLDEEIPWTTTVKEIAARLRSLVSASEARAEALKAALADEKANREAAEKDLESLRQAIRDVRI